MLSAPDDKQLIAQCLRGDQDAWQTLYTRVGKTITFVARWRKWNFSREQAEDICQEVFQSLIASLETFDFNCTLETFASSITKNKCISEIRRQSAAKRSGDRFAVPLFESDTLSLTIASTEDQLVDDESRRQLANALQQLGEKCRTILRLKYYDDYSYEEIGSRLEVPIGTVASRLKRCLLELKKTCTLAGGEQ